MLSHTVAAIPPKTFSSQAPQQLMVNPDMSKQGCKVFIGGLSWDTNDARLRTYFENYGCVKEAFVSYDRETGKPRGFGFVVFENPTVADRVVKNKHTIDRREVDAKHAMPRTETTGLKFGTSLQEHGSQGAGMRKIFVGGLPPGVTDLVLRQHFEHCGEVEDAIVMMDHHSKRSRGFGFVTFKEESAVEHIMRTDSRPVIFGKAVEVKRAVPREQLHHDTMIHRRRTAAAFFQGYSSAAQYGLYQQSGIAYPGALQQQAGVLNSTVNPYFIQQESDSRIAGDFAATQMALTPATDLWSLGEQHAQPISLDQKADLQWQSDLRNSSPSPIQNVSNLPQYTSYNRVPQDFYSGLDSKARPAFTQAKAEPRGSPEQVHSFENFAASLGASLPASGALMHS